MKLDIDDNSVSLKIDGNLDGIARLKMQPGSIMELATYDFMNSKIEVRLKDKCLSIFVYKYLESKLPDWWEDSEILWSNEI